MIVSDTTAPWVFIIYLEPLDITKVDKKPKFSKEQKIRHIPKNKQ